MERINLERRRLIQPRKEMKRLENKVLFQDFNRTIATVLFEENTYPWEILPKIHDFIMEVGMLLPKDEYDEIKEHVWVAKQQPLRRLHTLTALQLLDQKQKFVIVLSSEAMLS